MPKYKKRFDYIEQHRLKRSYTYTRTKAVIVFVLSGAFSIYFTPYFEKYGPVILSRMEDIAGDIFTIESNAEAEPEFAPVIESESYQQPSEVFGTSSSNKREQIFAR